ncbi:MAG: hypothetical protein FWC85_01090, partial [Elusimicrobia bacterium]|nr:hypothetical protein [Elusimicrobiota bacterium]
MARGGFGAGRVNCSFCGGAIGDNMGNIIRVLTIIFERVIPAFRNVVPQARAVLGFGGGIKFPFLSRFNKRHGTD